MGKILPIVAALLVLAAILLAVTGFGAVQSFGSATPLNTLSHDELYGKRATARVSDILGDFAAKPKTYDEEGNIAEYKERYVVYKTQEGYYLAICIRGARELINAEQYVNALEAYTTEQLSQFNMGNVEGTVDKLEDYLYTMLCSWLEQEGGEESETYDEEYLSQYVLPLVLENGHLGKTSRTVTWALTIVALLLIAAAIVLVIELLAGYWEKPMRSLIASEGADRADEIFGNAEEFGKKLRIGSDRIFVSGKLVTDIIRTDDVIWTYGRSRRLDNGDTLWSMVLKTTQGEEYAAQVGEARLVQGATDLLVSFGGPVVTGYDKDKARLYERDLTGFIGRARKLHAARKSEDPSGEAEEETEQPEE